MLDLPDGTVLWSDTSQQLYVYQPDGSPLAAGQPVINTLTANGDGSYHLTGTLFNGISEGAAYGDDAQMDSNYPLVRMTNSAGTVIYARTLNWSSTGVMTGTNVVSTDFVLPANFLPGTYSLVVVANGNASAPISFIYSPDALLVATTNLVFAGTVGGPRPCVHQLHAHQYRRFKPELVTQQYVFVAECFPEQWRTDAWRSRHDSDPQV